VTVLEHVLGFVVLSAAVVLVVAWLFDIGPFGGG
jgi:hypothetical protein